MFTKDVALTSCVVTPSDAGGPSAAATVIASLGPASAAMLRSLWDEYLFVLALDWSDAGSRLAGVNSPPVHPRLASVPAVDLGPGSDAGDGTEPNLAFTGLDALEYVTTRVTGGIISGANGAAQTQSQLTGN